MCATLRGGAGIELESLLHHSARGSFLLQGSCAPTYSHTISWFGDVHVREWLRLGSQLAVDPFSPRVTLPSPFFSSRQIPFSCELASELHDGGQSHGR